MATQRQVIPMREFARAMLDADAGFARRAGQFEQVFGPADEDTLSVLAQAAYFCQVNHEYRRNLFELCRAVRTGKPTVLYSHCQVTPARWIEINTYVIAVQRWLGADLPLPGGIDADRVDKVGTWLGERTPAKTALAELLLFKLVDDLLNYLSFATLGGNVETHVDEFPDFSEWYVAADGAPYSLPHAPAPGDGNRWTWKNETMNAFIEERQRRVRDGMPSASQDAKEMVRKILTLTQPPCMHRFTRYLDVQLASIGALTWRGALPPDDVPKADWQAFLDDAFDALTAWINDAQPQTDLGRRLHEALGEPTERGKAVLRDFLLPDTSENMGVSWDWLVATASTRGTTAASAFGDKL